MNTCLIRRLLFAFFLLAWVSLLSGTAPAATWTVNPGESIQARIDNPETASGDVIQVRTGTYTEDLVIGKDNLTLLSVDGPGLAVIQGAGVRDEAIYIGEGLGASIDGFVLRPGAENNSYGIYHHGGAPSNPVAVTRNSFAGFTGYGFYGSWDVLRDTSFTFDGNTVTGSYYGVFASGFQGCRVSVSDNVFLDCDNGISLARNDQGMAGTVAEITGNSIVLEDEEPLPAGAVSMLMVGGGGNGITVDSAEDSTTIADNEVRGGFFSGLTVNYVGYSGRTPAVLLVDGNTFSGTEYGIYFGDLAFLPAEVTVQYNVLRDNDCGISVNYFSSAAAPETKVLFANNSITGSAVSGFRNRAAELIDAKGNWWGDASGPLDTHDPSAELPGYSNPSGTGTAVSAFVDYSPWLHEPPAPEKPALLSPADGSTDVSVTPTLRTGPFLSNLAGVTHAATQWQVGTMAGDFSGGLVLDEESSSDFLAKDVPADILDNSATYYWRVRFRDSNGVYSQWSDAWAFTTAAGQGGGNGGGGCAAAGPAAPAMFLLMVPLVLLMRRK